VNGLEIGKKSVILFYLFIVKVDIQMNDTTELLIRTLCDLRPKNPAIRFARQHSYRSLFVVAPPFQQLRAFMTAVTVALREYPELLIYSYPGVAMSWQEEVIHSQGTLKAKRRDLIQEELERIEKYQSKGDLASPERVLSYLNKRETVV